MSDPLRPPRVSPTGIVEIPPGYVPSPRSYPIALRVIASAVVVSFLLVGTITTVASLGRYCLTSYAHSGPAPGVD